MSQNDKGITVIETLAVLVISVVLLGGIMFLLSQSHGSVSQLTKKEAVMKESRNIIKHISDSLRQSDATIQNTQNADEILVIDYGSNSTADKTIYSFKDSQVSSTQLFTGKQPIYHTLSKNVKSITITTDSTNKKVSIKLTMQLDKGKSATTNTVVNLPNLID